MELGSILRQLTTLHLIGLAAMVTRQTRPPGEIDVIRPKLACENAKVKEKI
ncbi:MAG: hypothetical protein GY847_33190 [Proteobacteria bacterium]|nr:hypothetical protein [Pseudomonadota bacterium]